VEFRILDLGLLPVHIISTTPSSLGVLQYRWDSCIMLLFFSFFKPLILVRRQTVIRVRACFSSVLLSSLQSKYTPKKTHSAMPPLSTLFQRVSNAFPESFYFNQIFSFKTLWTFSLWTFSFLLTLICLRTLLT